MAKCTTRAAIDLQSIPKLLYATSRCVRVLETTGAKEEAMSLSRPEAEAEGSLTFDGFLSFHCKTRADSQSVVSWATVRNVLY